MAQVLTPCSQHPDPNDCPDKVIVRTAGGWLGTPIPPAAGGGYMEVAFCPFCGQQVPAAPGEPETLYQQAKAAVLAVDRAGLLAVGTAADERLRRKLTSPRGVRAMSLHRPEVGRVVRVRGRLLGRLGDSPSKVAEHEDELVSVTLTDEDDYLVVLGRCRDEARVVSCKLREPIFVVESAASEVAPATRRLQEVADLLTVVLGHQPARSVWEALNEDQRELLADLIDESHHRYAQDVGMPESYASVDRWWR